MTKRTWLVKVLGHHAFTMIFMEGCDDPEDVCRSIFHERLEWVR